MIKEKSIAVGSSALRKPLMRRYRMKTPARKRTKTDAKIHPPFFTCWLMTCPSPGMTRAEHKAAMRAFFMVSGEILKISWRLSSQRSEAVTCF